MTVGCFLEPSSVLVVSVLGACGYPDRVSPAPGAGGGDGGGEGGAGGGTGGVDEGGVCETFANEVPDETIVFRVENDVVFYDY